jgi:3'-phosphoadenosine 5'-phosphosulfate synthase
LRKPEIYEHRKEERCARQFGLTNEGHPYIKVMPSKTHLLDGGMFPYKPLDRLHLHLS